MTDTPALVRRLREAADHIDREQSKIQAACISGDVWPNLLREAADALTALEQEREADTERIATRDEDIQS